MIKNVSVTRPTGTTDGAQPIVGIAVHSHIQDKEKEGGGIFAQNQK